MAVCRLPSVSCTNRKLLSSSFPASFVATIDDHRHLLRWGRHHRAGSGSTAFVCSAKKPRGGKKVKLPTPNMSDAELCDELREFLAAEGLSEDRIPSIAELSKRGRKDLANVIRRKGYKVVTELLKNQIDVKFHQSNGNEELLMKQTNDKIQSRRNEKLLMNQTTDEIQSESYEMNLRNETNNRIQLERQQVLLKNNKNDEIPSERNKELLRNQTNCKVQLNGSRELLKNQTEDEIQIERNLFQNHDSANNQLESSGSMVHVGKFSLLEQFPIRCNASAYEVSLGDDVETISEVGVADEETEINCLKDTLHQKEMELLSLLQKIEEEKIALSTIQKKANDEIRKFRDIDLAKESELQAAEEALHGLKEVLIEYHGQGQYVEVTGSFNGWHHRFKMDNSSSPNDPGFSERRESRWTTTLWLYPGIYEIKFIVDGDWRVDSQQEMLTRGYITNNVLRVER